MISAFAVAKDPSLEVKPSKDIFTKWHNINNGWSPHFYKGRVYWVFDQCYLRCVLMDEGITPKTAGRLEYCRKCRYNCCNPIKTDEKVRRCYE